MKKVSLFTVVFLFFVVVPVFAQEWSKEQLEVWKNVQAYNELAAKGDVEGFIQYFHSDFSGWGNDSAVPDNHDQRVEVVRHFMPRGKTLWYQIKPVAINVRGNFAFVHYYYVEQIQEGDKEPRMEAGRWTDILIKQGSRWVMIGDHGGPLQQGAED